MIVCENPIITKRYDFLYSHLNCSCIADTKEEENTGNIKIIAYSESREDNNNIRDYFYKQNYSGKYRILKEISSEEVNSIS